VTRGAALRAAVLVYLMLLVLAAVPPKLRPLWLDAPGDWAARALGAFSISPGLAIFSGSVTAVHRRATCLVISATRADGGVETLYANECPPTGFRWRIDPWDEMVLGLARRTRVERFVPGGAQPDAAEWWKLQALGDYFCHSPLASASERRELTLEIGSLLVLYSNGLHTEDRAVTCRWRCGAHPLATPRCERAPTPARRQQPSQGAPGADPRG
jgi:hypothetical protein